MSAPVLAMTWQEAMKIGSLENVQQLLKQGADIHEKDTNERTPLHLAVLHDHKTIIAYLLEKGAYIEARDIYGATPLNLSAFKDDRSFAYLLRQGASINTRDNADHNLLYTCVKYGQSDFIRSLVELGVNIYKRDEIGETPLGLARYLHRQASNNGFLTLTLSRTGIISYLTHAQDYFEQRIIHPEGTGQPQEIIPHYLLLAALKNDPSHINYFFENPQFDYSLNLDHYIKTMQLPQGTDDAGIYELMWLNLKNKQFAFSFSSKTVEDFIIKNKRGWTMLFRYNLHKKITSPDMHFSWK